MALPVSRKKRIAGIALMGVVVAGGGGAAYAYWTADGDGTGTATTGTTTGFNVTAAAPVGPDMVPAGPTQSVTFTVTNPGTGSQYLTGVTAVVAEDGGGEWTAGECSAADYVVGTPAFTPGVIAAGGNRTGTVTVGMIDTGLNQDDCKTVDVPLYFTAS